VLGLFALLACGPGPSHFSEIDLQQARRVAAAATVIEIVSGQEAPSPRPGASLRWEVEERMPLAAPAVPRGPLLVVAPTSLLGYRCAAALARGGNSQVRLVIVGSAEDRHELFALAREPHAREQEETPRDTDS